MSGMYLITSQVLEMETLHTMNVGLESHLKNLKSIEKRVKKLVCNLHHIDSACGKQTAGSGCVRTDCGWAKLWDNPASAPRVIREHCIMCGRYFDGGDDEL